MIRSEIFAYFDSEMVLCSAGFGQRVMKLSVPFLKLEWEIASRCIYVLKKFAIEKRFISVP